MTTNRLYFFGLILAVLLVLAYTFAGVDHGERYEDAVLRQRREKDAAFRQKAEQSPLLNRETFTGLSYFPPDPSYRLKAKVTVNANPEPFAMRMTDGKEEQYLKFATVAFTFKGKNHQLLLLRGAKEPGGPGRLFLAFTDKTSGVETYGGGRYLDVDWDGGEEVWLDFNQAYNPYCAYNPNYSCPVPPRENDLTVEVRAGELNFEKP